MGFGIILKKCYKCGNGFETSDDRVNYCTDCYLEEFEPLEASGGDLNEEQA